MFHILGRFAFTSSFSRRSSSGLSTGATRFGSCFCESGPLSIFVISYQSIQYSQFEAATLVLARSIAAPIRVPFPRDVSHHSYGSVIAPIISSRSEEISVAFPHPSRRASWLAALRFACSGGGLRAGRDRCDRSPFVQSRRRSL